MYSGSSKQWQSENIGTWDGHRELWNTLTTTFDVRTDTAAVTRNSTGRGRIPIMNISMYDQADSAVRVLLVYEMGDLNKRRYAESKLWNLTT